MTTTFENIIPCLYADLVLYMQKWNYIKIRQYINNMGRFGIYSIMSGNISLLIDKYDTNVNKCSERLE